MGHLTDSQYKTAGHTVLYVPDEGLKMQDPLAHKDKDLVYGWKVRLVSHDDIEIESELKWSYFQIHFLLFIRRLLHMHTSLALFVWLEYYSLL